MASLTPTQIIPTQSLHATVTLTGATATAWVVRTIHVESTVTGATFTLSFGADGTTGSRLYDAYVLTPGVPLVVNGWWVTQTGSGTHVIDMKSSSTVTGAVVGALYGYVYA